jgi:hypothetical protein
VRSIAVARIPGAIGTGTGETRTAARAGAGRAPQHSTPPASVSPHTPEPVPVAATKRDALCARTGRALHRDTRRSYQKRPAPLNGWKLSHRSTTSVVPSCPTSSLPQHHTPPSRDTAHGACEATAANRSPATGVRTNTVARSVSAPSTAAIVARPGATPVTVPSPATVATPGASLSQRSARSTVARWSSGRSCSRSVRGSPGSSTDVSGHT